MTDSQALSSHIAIVAVEVALSIQRLVKKYGQELHVVAWDAVLDITEALQDHIEVHAGVFGYHAFRLFEE